MNSDLCEDLLRIVLELNRVDKEMMLEGEGWLVVRMRVVMFQGRELSNFQCRGATSRGRY